MMATCWLSEMLNSCLGHNGQIPGCDAAKPKPKPKKEENRPQSTTYGRNTCGSEMLIDFLLTAYFIARSPVSLLTSSGSQARCNWFQVAFETAQAKVALLCEDKRSSACHNCP